MLRAVFSLGAITIISLALIPVQWLAVRMEWPLRRRVPTFYHRVVCAILGVHITETPIGPARILELLNSASSAPTAPTARMR